jgi:predicted GIY-YIG superfamily endonuclease
VYFEHLPNRSEAMRREAQIKRMKRSAKLFKISNFKPAQEGDSQISNDSRRTFDI